MRALCILLTFAALLAIAAKAAAGDKLKALIIDGQNNHDWKATTPVLVEMLESTGHFTADVATSPPPGGDMSKFQPKFSDYDVVLSNYNGEPWSHQTQDALVDYVHGGGGLVVVHAANNAFPDWEAFNQMIGLGGWGGRNEKHGPYVRLRDGRFVRDESAGTGGSHGQQHDFLIEARQPDHPILQGLPETWMHAKDELYDRLRGPALRLEVLATAYSDPATGGSGEHEPMLMTVRFGEGRVFHTVLGHSPRAMKCAGFQATTTRGAQWAATGEVTLPAPDDFPPADKVTVRE